MASSLYSSVVASTVSSAPKTYLKNILQNGVGRYVCQLQRITFRFSKTSGGSLGVRDYIEEDIVDFARKNPGIVTYVSPRNKIFLPIIIAEYLNGNRRVIECKNSSREEVKEKTEMLRTQSGRDIAVILQPWHTEVTSIQGQWTPFTNKPTRINNVPYPTDNPTFKYRAPSPSQVKKDYVEKLKNLKVLPEDHDGQVPVDNEEWLRWKRIEYLSKSIRKLECGKSIKDRRDY